MRSARSRSGIEIAQPAGRCVDLVASAAGEQRVQRRRECPVHAGLRGAAIRELPALRIDDEHFAVARDVRATRRRAAWSRGWARAIRVPAASLQPLRDGFACRPRFELRAGTLTPLGSYFARSDSESCGLARRLRNRCLARSARLPSCPKGSRTRGKCPCDRSGGSCRPSRPGPVPGRTRQCRTARRQPAPDASPTYADHANTRTTNDGARSVRLPVCAVHDAAAHPAPELDNSCGSSPAERRRSVVTIVLQRPSARPCAGIFRTAARRPQSDALRPRAHEARS